MATAPPVFVVSPDPDFTEIYGFALRASGLDVQSGYELPPLPASALVILDLHVPEHWEVVESAVSTGATVIVVTGFLSMDGAYRQRAFALGAAAFVLKPVTWMALVGVIRRVTAGERRIELLH